MRRTDALPKARGALTYGADLAAPQMLWAAYATSVHPHARLRSLPVEEARAMPGVRAVLTAGDIPRVLPKRRWDPSRPLLVETECRFQGEPVAVVAAQSLVEARAAARFLQSKAEWEVLPAFTDLEKEFPEWPDVETMKRHERVNAHVLARRGDFERAVAEADLVHEETFRTPMVAQVPMEPHACLARVQGDDWHVQTTTQTPFGMREDIADKLHLPEAKVRVEGTWVGGGFGGKNEALLETHALLLSRLTDRPVRLSLSFREEFLFTRTTQPAIFRMATCVRDGKPFARRTRLLLDTGASLPGRDFALGYSLGFTLGPYRWDTWELEGYALRTHRAPFGPHRAPLAPQCTFASDGHMDSLARRLKVDPFQLRLEQVWRTGDRTPFGQEVPPFAAAAALEQARALEKEWRRGLAPGHGIGVGLGFWSTGTSMGGEAVLTLGPKGLTILQGEREIGSGSVVEGLRVIAAQATGLPEDAVEVVYGDTSTAPFDSGVFGSRTVIALGRAVEKGCEALLKELARRSDHSPGEAGEATPRPRTSRGKLRLDLQGGEVFVRSPRGTGPLLGYLTEEERNGGGLRAHGKEYGRSHELDSSGAVEGDLYAYSDLIAAVHLAEVRVDPDTGSVRVVRYAAFHDAGKVLDREGYRGQVEGGLVMGLGTALSEEGLITSEGRLQNAGLLDYRVPTIRDAPSDLRIIAIEGFPGSGPQGSKGVGEPPIIPVPATVANAVADATGSRVLELPLTPERVARALALISPGAPTGPAGPVTPAVRGRPK